MGHPGASNEQHDPDGEACRSCPVPTNEPIASLSLAALRDLGMSDATIATYLRYDPLNKTGQECPTNAYPSGNK